MKHRSKTAYLLLPVILLLVALFLLSAVKILESSLLPRVEVPENATTRMIVRDGRSYYPRQDIQVVLLVGVDEEGKPQSSGSYNNKASADMVSLLVFDESAEEFHILSLNRDTMMDIPVLGLNGRPAGTVFAQLATSHNYGSGLKDSCENTRKAVSDFFYGLTIDHYFCMSMDGIRILNDSVGGVEVRIEDDFSSVDPSLVQGSTMLLSGDQAYSYIRSRAGVGTQLNVSRMDRQKQYMESFIDRFRSSVSKDSVSLTKLWEDLSVYAQTDCSAVVLNRMVSDYREYRFAGSLTPKGENILGEKYYEFHVDEQALDQMILELFYKLVD